MALLLSAIDLVVSAAFTLIVAARWVLYRRTHALLWAWALLVWTVAVTAETASAAGGAWTPLTYRVYYLCGALMVAAWLGAGSLHLSAARSLSRPFTIVVAGLSLIGGSLILTAPIDPSLLGATDSLGFVDVTVFPLIPVRLFVIVANILGSAAFIGSALYSLWLLRRRRIPGRRVAGVALIAVGALIAASAHTLGVLGGPGLFRVSELAAIVLIFSGYLLSLRGAEAPAAAVA